MRFVRFTVSPSLTRLVSPMSTQPTCDFLEVQREAEDVVRELDELAGHRLVEPVDERDPVADRDDRADLVDVHALRDARELGLDELGDFLGAD